MMKKTIVSLLALAAPAVCAGNVGHCDLHDHETGKFISKISFDLEAKRVCWDKKCNDAEEILVDSNQAFAFITVDGLGDMSIYWVPGCWNKDRAIGYHLYSPNHEPDHLRNCTMARACDN
jgi:hypothetical protein